MEKLEDQSELEKQFVESEKHRRETEATVKRQKEIPSEAISQMRVLEGFMQINEGILEAKAFKRLSEIVDLTQLSMTLTKKLREFNMDINDQTNILDKVTVALDGVQTELVALGKKLSSEFEEREKQRELENETLTKLNTYLDHWV